MIRKVRILARYPRYRRYVAGIAEGHPLHGIPARLVGDAHGDPSEFFEHYSAFGYWAAARCAELGQRLQLLDLGSPKTFLATLSAHHHVTSIVLRDCGDSITPIRYLVQDAGDPLALPERGFDVFTSTVTLPLLGLGRYGDKESPLALVKFVAELDRVMRPRSDLLVSMCLGKDVLNYNNGWFLQLESMRKVFRGWELVDAVVDHWSLTRRHAMRQQPRFDGNCSVADLAIGEYKVVFLHLRRGHQGEPRASS
jgi:hypothetical protein